MLPTYLSTRSTSMSAASSVKTEYPVFSASRWQVKRPKKDLPAPWFVSREIDILFVCGLAPWLAGILFFLVTGANGAYPPTKIPQQILTYFFVAASLIIGESHQFTSILRYYSAAFRKRTKRYRLQRIPIWFMYLLVAELVLVSTFSSIFGGVLQGSLFIQAILLNLCVLAFPVVLMQHVCGQASAIVQQYCRRGDYSISKSEKYLLDLFSWLLAATGACSIAVPFNVSNDGNLSVPFVGSIHLSSYASSLAALTVTASLMVAAYVICRGMTKNDWPPMGAALLAVNCVALILLAAPFPGMTYVWLFVPLFFHATQHWALAWSTQKREVQQDLESKGPRNNSFAALCMFTGPVLITTLLVLFMPLILNHTPHHHLILDMFFPGETLSVFLSMFVFYAHYFADRVVWRAKN